ncbi:MAG TPA: universal stress protein [Candidatus Angelobacter sp.]|jgi:hypothetical protein|nr:universal stress protein [Candidatus Angelobacter sp.]
MPQIIAVRTQDDSFRDTIAVVLSQDAVCLGPDGQPWAGVSLSAELARALAERLLGLAREVEGQKRIDDPNSFHSFAQITSILVFHDGSEQSHRAFRLALDLASRSLAIVQLAGIFTVQPDRFEPSSSPDDHQWQRGWLDRLTQVYSGEAAKEGIELRTKLIAATDQHAVADMFDSGRFDLIIVPHSFSRSSNDGIVAKTLSQALSTATRSKVLFCP